ncbi:membrane protein [Pantoea rodasii]|uniref:Membrane protein n=1 Tax=Pantoea rodasii TaxID=1076549 RepID=A0A0B1R9D7_9GAMM|nr:YoaK family protein [Pantoea rodasii]KHJ69239.1 membrane protein [Pantoea rodasii]
MLLRRKKHRTHGEDRLLALTLATTAGVLNAMAFGAFGFFPSHMTGNTSQLSAEAGSWDLHGLLFLAVLILAFVTGATLARLAVAFGLRRNVRTVFCLLLLCEGMLLLATSLVEIRWYSIRNNGEVLVTLALLMGLHNATSTQLSGGRVRSTHVTGTLTDAGMALGSWLRASFSRREAADAPVHRALLSTHLVTIVSFLSGCVAGYFLFVRFGFNAMAGLACLLILIALGGIARALHLTGWRFW